MDDERSFKKEITQLIVARDTETAVRMLSQHYGVAVPSMKVGMPKQHRKKLGCYVSKTRTIHVANREKLHDPSVILHEFYHHLRMNSRNQGGTERHANLFVQEFMDAFQARSDYSFRVSYKWIKPRI